MLIKSLCTNLLPSTNNNNNKPKPTHKKPRTPLTKTNYHTTTPTHNKHPNIKIKQIDPNSHPLKLLRIRSSFIKKNFTDIPKVLRETKGNQTLEYYYEIIKGYLSHGSIDRAIFYLGEAKRIPGVFPGRYDIGMRIYNLLINYYATQRQFDEAVRVFGEMGDGGVERDVATFGAMMKGVRSFAEALEFFNMMKVDGIPRDKGIFDVLVKQCLTLDDFDTAIEVMKEDGADDYLLVTTLLKRNLLTDDSEFALTTVETIKRSGGIVNRSMHQLVLRNLLKHDVEVAIQYVDNLILKKIHIPKSYQTLINHLIKENMTEEAQYFFETAKKAKALNEHAINEYMKFLQEQGRHDELLEIFNELRGITTIKESTLITVFGAIQKQHFSYWDIRNIFFEEIENGYHPSIAMFTIMITVAGRSNLPEEVDTYLNMLKERRIPLDQQAYESIQISLAKYNIGMALTFFYKMKILGYSTNIKIHNALLHGYYKNDQQDQAYEEYKLILNSDTMQPDSFTFTFALRSAIKIEDYNRAKEIYLDYENSGIEPDEVLSKQLFFLNSQNNHL